MHQERDAKKAAQQEVEARSAHARGLERRLSAALDAAALAENSAATCIEVSADPPDVDDRFGSNSRWLRPRVCVSNCDYGTYDTLMVLTGGG